jgi:hypothetical protein
LCKPNKNSNVQQTQWQHLDKKKKKKKGKKKKKKKDSTVLLGRRWAVCDSPIMGDR